MSIEEIITTPIQTVKTLTIDGITKTLPEWA